MGLILLALFVVLVRGFVLSSPVDAATSARIVRDDHSQEMIDLGIPLYEWKNSEISNPESIVVVIHGAAQQAGSVDVFARRLAAFGYLVVAPDLRGDGRWKTMPVAAGTQANSGGAFGDFVKSCQDLNSLLTLLRSKYPHTSLYCVGESAGATVVLSAVSQDDKNVKGIILLAAGCQPHLHSPGSMGSGFIGKLLNVTQPVDMSNYITKYSSDDKRVGQEMISDPLSKNSLSALELLGTLNFITKAPQFAASMPKAVPALVMQGQLDQIVEPSSAQKVFSILKTTDKKFIMLPESGHILIGTSYLKPTVFYPILQWLEAHGGTKIK